jgi:hypothetical protein
MLAVAIGIVAVTAGLRGWQYWKETTAAGPAMFPGSAGKARSGDTDAALPNFQALEQTGYGSYPVLAQMRAATVLADNGDTAAAISAFSAIGKDVSQPVAIRDAARLRAAYLLIDNGSYSTFQPRSRCLAVPGNPARHSAREALGIAAYKAGDHDPGRAMVWRHRRQTVKHPGA